MTTDTPTATADLAHIMGTLQELTEATMAGDQVRYQAALQVAQTQGITPEQTKDAYNWGRSGRGNPSMATTPTFDHLGH